MTVASVWSHVGCHESIQRGEGERGRAREEGEEGVSHLSVHLVRTIASFLRVIGSISNLLMLPPPHSLLSIAPTAVMNVLATPMTTTSVSLTWVPPSDNGGQAILYYTIQYGIVDQNTNSVNMTTTSDTQILLTGLVEYSLYQ